MIMIMTSTVNGFFTLIFDILSFQRVAHYACRILELFFGYGTEINNIPVMGKIGDIVTIIFPGNSISKYAKIINGSAEATFDMADMMGNMMGMMGGDTDWRFLMIQREHTI